jgi:hypothetical protein
MHYNSYKKENRQDKLQFTCYRGGRMSEEELEKFKKNINGHI